MIIQSIALLDQLDKDVNTFSMRYVLFEFLNWISRKNYIFFFIYIFFRIREWYSYHFPELVKIVPDNYTFAKCVKVVKNRKELTEEGKYYIIIILISLFWMSFSRKNYFYFFAAVDALEEAVMDSAKAKAIIDASKMSMGMDIAPLDLMNIEKFANRVIALAEYRKELSVS